MTVEALNQTATNGFGGTLNGMSLSDVLQLKNLNRYTGCLTVEFNNKKGIMFFRDGDLIHTEVDDLTGRDAFFQILQWPNGEFRTDPKVVTTCRTISESLTYLLLEAHRLQDEEKYQGLEEPKERLTASNVGKGSQSMSDINTKLKTVPEVEYAVVQTKEGVPVDDASFEGATHAANGLYLSMFANQLGNLLGVGELVSATVQGTKHHMLMFQSKTHYLNIAVSGTCQLGSAEANIRKVLTQK